MNNIILDTKGFSLFCPFIDIPNYVIHDVFFFHELSICVKLGKIRNFQEKRQNNNNNQGSLENSLNLR